MADPQSANPQVIVRVADVWVGRVDVASAPGSKGKTEERLMIRLHVQQLLDATALPGKKQGPANSLKEEHQPKLADSAGKDYGLLDVRLPTGGAEGRRAAEIALTSQVLVFEAPTANVQTLRLVIPAAAWGGTGSFRFAIPGTWIKR